MCPLNLPRAKHILIFAITVCSIFVVGCASRHSTAAKTVREAEKLVAQYPAAQKNSTTARRKTTSHPAEVPAVGEGLGMMPPPPALGPSRPPVDAYRKHLFELYAGQQQIIESLEANDEGPAMDLPSDISNDELLNILQKQQKLIKELTKRQR